MRASQSGMTLIELLVAVVIVAILAGIAYPSYQTQVRQSRRSAAQAFLMDVATRQQQRLVDVRSYATALDDLGMPLPGELEGFYAVAIDTPGAPARQFTLRATPAGAQADDACGELTLDEVGAKTPDNCW